MRSGRLLLVSAVAVFAAAVAVATTEGGTESAQRSKVATAPMAGWTITDLGTLGGTYSEPAAINPAGEVVGHSTTENGETHAFLWRRGKMIDLGTLGGTYSAPTAINERGQIVGSSETASGIWHAFLWEKGQMIDLGTLADEGSYAQGINAQGEIVGEFSTVTGWHGFLWKNGTRYDLGSNVQPMAINNRGQIACRSFTTPEADYDACVWEKGTVSDLGDLGYEPGASSPSAMNERGQVVGYSPVADSGWNHAFLGQPGKPMIDLGVLRADQRGSSQAEDINASTHVVGTSTSDPDFFSHGFIWRDGVMTDLGTLGGPTSWAFAVNNADQVVGYSLTSDWAGHAFLWSKGQMLDLGTLSGRSEASAINAGGQVVGTSETAEGETHAVLWSR